MRTTVMFQSVRQGTKLTKLHEELRHIKQVPQTNPLHQRADGT